METNNNKAVAIESPISITAPAPTPAPTPILLPSGLLSSSTVSGIGVLVLRVLTFLFLLVALILISIQKGGEDREYGQFVQVKRDDIHSYNYMMATIIIGCVYSLCQMALSIFSVVSGKRLIMGDFSYFLDFSGDEIISYLLATGAAAGFGATVDVPGSLSKVIGVHFGRFFDKANASAGLLFFGFLFTATSSVFASYALPKTTL